MSAVFEGLGAVAAVAGQEELAGPLEIIAKVAGITKWEYDYPGSDADQTGSGTRNDPVSWKVALSDQAENTKYMSTTPNVPADLAATPDGWLSCYLSVDLVKKTTTQHWWANTFDIHGFTGVSNATIDPTTVDLVEDQMFYTRYKPANGTSYTE
jgi:hypothetical protein